MIFQEIFKSLEKKMEGVEGAIVIDKDGVPLDIYLKEGATVDMENIGVEIATMSRNLVKFAQSLNLGVPEEFIFKTDKYSILTRFISEQITYCVVAGLKEPVGRGRFYLKTTSWEMAKKISH